MKFGRMGKSTNMEAFLQQIGTFEFLTGLVSIMFINIILSGDNAVVIAMAVRSLAPKKRRQGIILGTAGAVVLRIGLTFVAARLLEITFLKLAGGLMIGWLAIKLFVEGGPAVDQEREVATLGKAIVIILVADLIMSTDNVLAVAGASKGSLALLIFGLGTSIPLVVFASNMLSKLMDRYPIIVYCGAAVLGKVAGEMIITDPFVVKLLNAPGPYATYAAEGVCAVAVVVAGKTWMRWRPAIPRVLSDETDPFYLADWDLR
ncbi:MAG TPA: TerC family protein [Syntrophorhabdales bacterium]|nr:TerC family protein [Syntrophorhabdales bacterium]